MRILILFIIIGLAGVAAGYLAFQEGEAPMAAVDVTQLRGAPMIGEAEPAETDASEKGVGESSEIPVPTPTKEVEKSDNTHGDFFKIDDTPGRKNKDGLRILTFGEIGSFTYKYPSDREGGRDVGVEKIYPQKVIDLHGEKVEMSGYMTPMEVDDEGYIKTFALARNVFGCCFGDMPLINEIVDVTVPGDGLDPLTGNYVTVVGQFRVGELYDEFGYILSVYQMKAKSVVAWE